LPAGEELCGTGLGGHGVSMMACGLGGWGSGLGVEQVMAMVSAGAGLDQLSAIGLEQVAASTMRGRMVWLFYLDYWLGLEVDCSG